MSKTSLYLVAYDVCNPKRLRQVWRFLQGYKVAGQKSVFEIMASAADLQHILSTLEKLIDPTEDRLHILLLDPRMKPRCLGRAQTFAQHHFVIT